MPEKPMNASDMMPAVIRAIAVPRNAAGTSATSRRSRMAAKQTRTRCKPDCGPEAEEYRLYEAVGFLHVEQCYTEHSAIGCDKRNIDAQYLVQHRAQAAHHDLSELHTCRDDQDKPDGAQVRTGPAAAKRTHATGTPLADDKVSTKPVARDMPVAASRLRETPRNGHRPRNLTNTKLLTRTVPMKMTMRFVIPLL